MKEKINRSILELGSYSKRSYVEESSSGGKIWAVPFIRYSGPFLKLTREELQQIDQRTRKLMTMHRALHPKDDMDRLYVLKKEEEDSPALMLSSMHQ